MRLVIAFGLISVLLSCAPRGQVTFHPEAAAVGDVQRIFVSTTRELAHNGRPTGQRGKNILFGRIDVSVPQNRKVGQIKWPLGKDPDPARHFLVSDFERLNTQASFEGALRTELGGRTGVERTTSLFVHGYNNRFSEGLYRFAQMNADLDMPFLPLHYSWPSAGHPLGYGYDRDSMLFARDGLEKTIQSATRSGSDEILLIGHSMGALLTMETLRQMSIANPGKGMNKIGGVILISPDIDIDLFRSQAEKIGDLPQPFVIFSSSHDKALRLSAGLTGQSARLGNTTDVEKLAGLDVTLIDLSAFSDGNLDHNLAVASPAFLQILHDLPDLYASFGNDPAANPGLLPGTLLVVQNATGLVVSN